MAGKAHSSRAPDAKIQDGQAAVNAHRGHGGGVVSSGGPSVGAPPKSVVGRKVTGPAVDMRDNDGDGGAAGTGPTAMSMRGEAGAC
jgi:hypothetical protein